jgi:hypothetical protein
MPQPHEQNRSFEVKTLKQSDASITVQVGRANETVVFTYTPPYKVEVDFPGDQAAGEKEQPHTPEAVIPPEYPAITIEGNPARATRYDWEKHIYLLRLAHHPDASVRTLVNFYDVVARGEKADEFFKLFVTDTRMQLHITGLDISETVKKHKGTAGIIEADSIEIIHGRRAGSDILAEKVRLADRE